MSALVQQFRALPRAAKWLAYLGVVLVAYFAVVWPLLKVSDSVNSKAAQLKLEIAQINELRSDVGAGGDLRKGRLAYGNPQRPEDGKVSPESFTRVVNGILDANGVEDRNVTERRVRATGEQAGNYERLILDITFEAKPATVIAVLSDLEKASEVAAVGRVRIDKGNARDEEQQLVRATIAPEAWIGSGAGAPSAPSSTPEVLP